MMVWWLLRAVSILMDEGLDGFEKAGGYANLLRPLRWQRKFEKYFFVILSKLRAKMK